MNIIPNIGKCTGCRICELVCSFYHTKAFSPELSSIRVTMNNRTGDIKLAIDETCDLCQGEESTQCVKYCVYKALEEVS